MPTEVFLNTTEITASSNSSDDGIVYPRALLDSAAVCFIIFAIVGVTGNFISILALSRCPRLRNATTAFIINLCVADLIFCAFSSPLQAVTYIQRSWTFGDGLLCKLFPFVSYVNALVSLFTVLAIAINRYICIVHPLRYASFYRTSNVGAMIAFLWICVLGIMSLPFFQIWGKLGYDNKGRSCDILESNGKTPKDILFGIALGLPTVVFLFCYSRINWVVRQASRKIECSNQQPPSSDIPTIFQVREAIQKPHFWAYLNNSLLRFREKEVRKVPRERKELKVLKVTLIIFLTYVMCYFPVSLVKLIGREEDVPILNVLGYLLAYLSNCINPLIYIAASDDYRRAYFDLFSCRK